MEYLIGSLMTVVLFALVLGAYYIGTRQRKPRAKPIDDEEQRKQEQIRKDFDTMMNYNVEKAYKAVKHDTTN